MPNTPVIDTHVHLWDTNRFSYPWLSDLPQLARPFVLEDYWQAAACAQIEAMVFMQCDAAPAQALAEAEWVRDLAQSDPRIKAIIPFAPLEQGDKCRAHLEAIQEIPLVKGVRRLIQPEADPEFCLQPEFIRGVRMLAEHDLSFDVCISHGQMAHAIEMARQCPEVSFILDHIGKPDIKNGVAEPWSAQLGTLSNLPNVVCKLSGMVTEADHEGWTKEQLKPYVDRVIECFGFDRVMYGGDWPVVTLAGTYGRWVGALDWALTGCASDELRKLFHDNAVRVYRLGQKTV